jgi:hypothetical protein
LFFQRLINPFEISARVNHGGFSGVFTPNEGTILLEGRHWNDLVFHRRILWFALALE